MWRLALCDGPRGYASDLQGVMMRPYIYVLGLVAIQLDVHLDRRCGTIIPLCLFGVAIFIIPLSLPASRISPIRTALRQARPGSVLVVSRFPNSPSATKLCMAISSAFDNASGTAIVHLI